jgi:predicted kinase
MPGLPAGPLPAPPTLSVMVRAWVASLPCSPGPPLSGGTAVAVTAASLPAPAGVSARAYRRISVLPAATRMSYAAGPSCLIRGAMSQSQRCDSQYEEPFRCPSAAVPAAANGQARQDHPPACQPCQPQSTPAEVRSGSVVTQDPCAATMLLMVGLPGAGKTTRAKELAVAHRALRLTPDEWMIPLFGEPMADGKRFVLEGRLITVALQALRLGTSVVLDYGLWGRDERSALRWLARSVRASCQVVYLPVDKDVQLARIAHRQATTPHRTFPMTEADVDTWRQQFQVPDAAELDGSEIPGPPAGWPGWPEWAVDHWPSLTDS